MAATLDKEDLVLWKECYEVVGVLFEVYKKIGGDLPEKVYQRATASEFRSHGIPFKEQVMVHLQLNGDNIGLYYLDFLVRDIIVLEIKKNAQFKRSNITQVNSYLKATGLQLGILANFTSNGVRFKRIVNLY